MRKQISKFGPLWAVLSGFALIIGAPDHIDNVTRLVTWIRTLGSAPVSLHPIAVLGAVGVVGGLLLGILGWIWPKDPWSRSARESRPTAESVFHQLRPYIVDMAQEFRPRPVFIDRWQGPMTESDVRREIWRREFWTRLTDLGIPVPDADAKREEVYEFLTTLAVLASKGDLGGAQGLLTDGSHITASRDFPNDP